MARMASRWKSEGLSDAHEAKISAQATIALACETAWKSDVIVPYTIMACQAVVFSSELGTRANHLHAKAVHLHVHV